MACNDGYPDTGYLRQWTCDGCGRRNTHMNFCDCTPCAECGRLSEATLCEDCEPKEEIECNLP